MVGTAGTAVTTKHSVLPRHTGILKADSQNKCGVQLKIKNIGQPTGNPSLPLPARGAAGRMKMDDWTHFQIERRTDRIIIYTDATRDGVFGELIIVIENGVTTETFMPGDWRAKNNEESIMGEMSNIRLTPGANLYRPSWYGRILMTLIGRSHFRRHPWPTD
jgi:hypothetical protein